MMIVSRCHAPNLLRINLVIALITGTNNAIKIQVITYIILDKYHWVKAIIATSKIENITIVLNTSFNSNQNVLR